MVSWLTQYPTRTHPVQPKLSEGTGRSSCSRALRKKALASGSSALTHR